MGYLIKKKITPVKDKFWSPSPASFAEQYNNEDNADLNAELELLRGLEPKRGRRNKISEADLEVIQKRLSVGDAVVKVARDYGVSYQNVWLIKKRMTLKA